MASSRRVQVLVQVSADHRQPAEGAVQQMGPTAASDQIAGGILGDRARDRGSDHHSGTIPLKPPLPPR
jgi:hypothetical protein